MAKWKEIPSPEAIVRAALEVGFWEGRSCGGSIAQIDAALTRLASLASDPEAVAEIIAAAKEGRG